jgi:lambda family phage portal protein
MKNLLQGNYIPVPRVGPTTRAARMSGNAAGNAGGELTVRRWEAAETNRLNRAQWEKATGQSINTDLASDLETLRTRANWELSRNSTLEGVVNTFCDDVVGENGPGLQVVVPKDAGGDANYASTLESVVNEVFDDLDSAGQQSLADLMGLFIRGLWTDGEFLAQIVDDPDAQTPVKMRLKPLAARRLATRPEDFASTEVTLGVKRNRLGRAVEYYLKEFNLLGPYEVDTGRFIPTPAADLFHGFLVLEAGQVRGAPWLATSLQPMSDLREFDAQVLDAARQATKWAVALYTDHPDAEYLELNESEDIEPGQYRTLPPGYKPWAGNPPQPATNYVDYRAERQRDAGRGRGMPLMTVRLDSSKHNYSAARFDAQVYRRGIARLRAWLRRRLLVRLVNLIAREATLFAFANPSWKHAKAFRRPPAELKYRWTWQAFPHVDDEKEANGQRIRMEDGTLTFSDACLENGQDPDAVIAQLEKDTEKLLKVGITPPWMRNEQTPPSLPQPSEELTAQADAEGIDLATAMSAQKSSMKRGGSQPMNAAMALNGAQILAAVDVVGKLGAGQIVAEAAVELLTAVGIPADRAKLMVEKTPVKTAAADPDKQFKQDIVKQLVTGANVGATLGDQKQLSELVEQSGLPRDVLKLDDTPIEKPAATKDGTGAGDAFRAPPVIQVNVPPAPEQKAPVVNVHLPPPAATTTVTKTIERDAKGLITGIREESSPAAGEGSGDGK